MIWASTSTSINAYICVCRYESRPPRQPSEERPLPIAATIRSSEDLFSVPRKPFLSGRTPPETERCRNYEHRIGLNSQSKMRSSSKTIPSVWKSDLAPGNDFWLL